MEPEVTLNPISGLGLIGFIRVCKGLYGIYKGLERLIRDLEGLLKGFIRV